MALNKNAAYRYRVIDNCLRSRNYSIQELQEIIAEKLFEEFDIDSGISERQLLHDIQIMRKNPPEGYNAPIVRKKGVLSYSDKSFSISSSPLINKDLELLQDSMNILKQLKDLPHFNYLKNIYDKLVGTVTSENFKKNNGIIKFDDTSINKGTEFITPLYEMIKQQKISEIKYKPYHKDTLTLKIHPYLLKEYRGRWFLIGYSEDFSKLINLALDRINSLKSITGNFTTPPEDLPKLHKDIVGVTLPDDRQVIEIKIKVNAATIPYWLTKPIHSSQKLVCYLENNDAILQFNLIPNFEFKAILLSYGSKIELLEPEHLRIEFTEEVHKVHNIYST